MGLAQIHVDAVAGTAALPNQGHQAAGRDRDAHAGGVGDAPARLLIASDEAFGLGDTVDSDGLALTELFLEECPQPVPVPRLLTTFEVSVA
jgi:hypothetical protein